MKSCSNKEDGSGGQQPGKPPHWRRREHAPTTVYVVHPTQFRAVVQQLTGPASSPPRSGAQDQVGGGHGTGGANAVARQHGQSEESGGGRTLGQMHQDCMAWANADDS